MNETGILRRFADRLFFRILMMLARGRVTLVDDSGVVQCLQATLSATELQDRIPRLAEFGFASNPPLDSDLVAVFLNGDRANGIVIATGHQASRPTGLKSGESMLYDVLGKHVYLREDGVLHIEAPKIHIHATEWLRRDIAGYADQTEFVGGTDWKTKTWHAGATVTADPDPGIEPPEVADA